MKPSLISLADIKQISFPTGMYILVDNNTRKDCLPLLQKELGDNHHLEIIEIQAGEEQKTIETCLIIWTELEQKKAKRNSILINLGGGVITDIGGFVASTYMRGISFYHFPTSLLGMVDAAIGGKTGVDLHHIKNKIGTFAAAEAVYLVPTFLQTLAQEQMVSGFAEMLKHGLVANAAHFEHLSSITEINVASIEAYIMESAMIKQGIVEEDPTEQGRRKILNFGHTIGHAVESYYLERQKPILHGMAVAIGMYYETKLSQELGYLSSENREVVLGQIQKHYRIPKFNEKEVDDLLDYMRLDKKNDSEEINFSLLENIGKCKYNVNVSTDKISLVFKN